MLSRSLWCSTDSLSHPVVQNFVPALASCCAEFRSRSGIHLHECERFRAEGVQNSLAVCRGRLCSRSVGGDRKRLHQGQAPGRPRECPEKLRPQAQALRAERSKTALRPLTRGYPVSCRPGGEKGNFCEGIEGHERG